MELMVRDGDYVSDGRGSFRRAEGSAELLQRVLWKLSIRRGCFPPLPGLGSQLYRMDMGAHWLATRWPGRSPRGEARWPVNM